MQDLTLEQIKSLRAKQGFEFRDQSKNGQYQVQTLTGRWDHEALRLLCVCALITAAAAVTDCPPGPFAVPLWRS
jgi:hypothetical protein